MNQPNKELLIKYIKGSATEQERAAIEKLFMNGEKNEELMEQLRKDWESDESDAISSDLDLKPILDQIHKSIYQAGYLKKQSPIRRIIKIYSKVAAILLLPLILTGGLLFMLTQNRSDASLENSAIAEIYAPLGSRVSFSLPDGTVGMLNSGSRLTYSLPFNNNRKVSLTGESWFEVKSDENKPFQIDLGKSVITVLGTSFNVNAYPDENYVEVVLSKGKVEFLDNVTNEVVAMQPSERLVFQDGKVTKTETDPEKYFGWTAGKLTFRGDPMAEVARRIERWYNVEVVLADKDIEKYSYRGTFEDDNLEDVFMFLSMTSPITYKITPRVMNADGTYNKQVITINLKK